MCIIAHADFVILLIERVVDVQAFQTIIDVEIYDDDKV